MDYTHIINEKVVNVVTFKGVPFYTPKEGKFLSVEGMKPRPDMGDDYDEKTGQYSKPEKPVQPKSPEEKAKDILKTVNLSELEKSDIGKALKALLYLQGLI